MMNKNHLKIERLIGKIDNDFNIDTSDWIPRVAAWTIDALSQMKVLPMVKKRRTLEVVDKIACIPCPIKSNSLKVFDKNGCEIPELNKYSNCCGKNQIEDKYIGVSRQDDDVRYRTVAAKVVAPLGYRNYVLVDDNKIELNFNTDEITIETFEIATYYDDYFNCEVPYIYDDGLLLEALSWYCLFKILSRGYKHQIFGLGNSEPTNPYVQWINIKDKAAASVLNSIRKSNKDEGWNNFFYNSTFLPRHT